MDKFLSRKLIVALAYPLFVGVAKVLKLDVSDELLMTLAGVAASYMVGQSVVDMAAKKADGAK